MHWQTVPYFQVLMRIKLVNTIDYSSTEETDFRVHDSVHLNIICMGIQLDVTLFGYFT
jgi:hypothetical protein